MFSALPLKMETFQMKKLICTLLTLAMLLGLAGCTTAPTGSGDASAGVTEPAGQDSTEEPTGGTGLGLAIVKHIARIHNARIKLDSVVDEGTTITVIFETAS